jgi:hypothetical protein
MGTSVRVSTVFAPVPTIEEIAYDAGRHALADQDSLVSGIRQRAGTLVAAHALVASFLGGTVLRSDGLAGWGGVAVVALAAALAVAAGLLAPWRLKFAVDARDLYERLYPSAAAEAEHDTLGWLAAAAFLYQDLRAENARRVTVMSHLCAGLAVLLIVQTVSWLIPLGLD